MLGTYIFGMIEVDWPLRGCATQPRYLS